MLVAELYDLRQFRLIEQPIPEPAPGEVQARVEAVGICGSDLHYYSEGGIGDTPCVYPMVLGHEPVGVIEKVGAGVSGWSVGDRVALEAAIFCHHCEFCLTGHPNLCEKGRFLSTPGDPGFFREHVNLPAANVLPLPPHLGFAEASLFEPLAVILHSMRFIEPRAGETAAVFGAGPIGLLTIAMLKLSGVMRVWAVDPVAHRRELALALGADAAIDPASVDPVRQILADTGQRGVDAAVDCVARDESINQSIRVTRNAGQVVITGIPSEVRTSLEFHALRRKEASFFTVRRANHTGHRALALLEAEPARFAPIVTHSRPLEGIASAFETLDRYEEGVGKMVIAGNPAR